MIQNSSSSIFMLTSLILVGLAGCHKHISTAQSAPQQVSGADKQVAPEGQIAPETAPIVEQVATLKGQIAAAGEVLKTLPSKPDLAAQTQASQQVTQSLTALNGSLATLAQSLDTLRTQVSQVSGEQKTALNALMQDISNTSQQ